ncbi:hypothetical protein ACEPAG_6005 [Sanghuangporus baumii]
MPRIRKKTSKRGTSHQRARIKHKVAESRKKAKKATRKNPHPQWKSKKPKDPGIPNSFPYKAQILAEIAEQRRQEEEERQQRKEQKRAEKAVKSKADEAETEDGVEDTMKADDKCADANTDAVDDENESEVEDDHNSKTLEDSDVPAPAPDSGFTGISSLPAASSVPASKDSKKKKNVTFRKGSALPVVPESSGAASTLASASASASTKGKKERRKRKERTVTGRGDSSLSLSSANTQSGANASATGDPKTKNADEAAKRRRKRART